MKKIFYAVLLVAGLAGCNENARKTASTTAATGQAQDSTANLGSQEAIASITARDLLRHTTVLASDAYEGRSPGTRGEDSTIAYLTRQFKRLGLQPGNPDGTYIQQV